MEACSASGVALNHCPRKASTGGPLGRPNTPKNAKSLGKVSSRFKDNCRSPQRMCHSYGKKCHMCKKKAKLPDLILLNLILQPSTVTTPLSALYFYQDNNLPNIYFNATKMHISAQSCACIVACADIAPILGQKKFLTCLFQQKVFVFLKIPNLVELAKQC